MELSARSRNSGYISDNGILPFVGFPVSTSTLGPAGTVDSLPRSCNIYAFTSLIEGHDGNIYSFEIRETPTPMQVTRQPWSLKFGAYACTMERL